MYVILTEKAVKNSRIKVDLLEASPISEIELVDFVCYKGDNVVISCSEARESIFNNSTKGVIGLYRYKRFTSVGPTPLTLDSPRELNIHLEGGKIKDMRFNLLLAIRDKNA